MCLKVPMRGRWTAGSAAWLVLLSSTAGASELPGVSFEALRPAARGLPALRLVPEEPLVPEVSEEGANTGTLLLASAGLTALVLGVGTQAWWSDGLEPFSFRETGFFGRDTYAGGSDKAGHIYSAYVSVAIVTAVYEALGMKAEVAPWYAALFTGLLFNGFEVIDGFTEFGFEYGDVIANTLGIGLGLLTHLYPEVDDLVGLRLAYVPSEDFVRTQKGYLQLINDYSGMLFLLDVKGKGVAHLLGHDPGLARYLVGGLAFGTNRYSPVKVWEERQRFVGLHFGLNTAELLRSSSGGDAAVDAVARIFDFFALPFFSIVVSRELNHGGWYVGFGVANRQQISLGAR